MVAAGSGGGASHTMTTALYLIISGVLTQDEEVQWGTDDTRLKGGDYFRARHSRSR